MPQDAERARSCWRRSRRHRRSSPSARRSRRRVSAEHGVDAHRWHRLTPAQQAFVAEIRGLPASASQFLARSAEAARSGPAALFGFLLKQPDLPEAEVRQRLPEPVAADPRPLPQFEKHFGPLSDLERHRIQAARCGGARRLGQGRAVLAAASPPPVADDGDDRQARLSRGVSGISRISPIKHPEVEGDSDSFLGDPVISYLERSSRPTPTTSRRARPDQAVSRRGSRSKDWHRLAEEAVQRFPDNSAVLLQATESAVARKAYKKAAGFARRLLQIDPINAGRAPADDRAAGGACPQADARQARGSGGEGTGAAAEWERPDGPERPAAHRPGAGGSAPARATQAQVRLREGVALAGSGVAGWFRAAFEAELMKVDRQSCRRGCARSWPRHARCRQRKRRSWRSSRRWASRTPVRTSGRLPACCSACGRGCSRPPTSTGCRREFQALAETLARFEAFDLLGDIRPGGAPARARQPDLAVPRDRRPHQGHCTTSCPCVRRRSLVEMADAAANRAGFPRGQPDRTVSGAGVATPVKAAPLGRGPAGDGRSMTMTCRSCSRRCWRGCPKGATDSCAGWSGSSAGTGPWPTWSSSPAPRRSDRNAGPGDAGIGQALVARAMDGEPAGAGRRRAREPA